MFLPLERCTCVLKKMMFLPVEKNTYLPLERNIHLPLKRKMYLAVERKHTWLPVKRKILPASGDRNSCLHVDG